MRVFRLKKYFDDITIHQVDNLIIDGHHRYIAYKIALRSGTKCFHQQPPYKRIKDLIVDYEEGLG